MDINELRKKLEQEKTALEEEIKKLNKVPDFGSEPTSDSMEEESDESAEYGNQLAMAQELKERVEDIEDALRKMDRGEYGICDQCGKHIEDRVLELNPASQLCQECKKDLM